MAEPLSPLMDVTALRSFREVCRSGSITAAARSLGCTQSALSRQITRPWSSGSAPRCCAAMSAACGSAPSPA